MVVGVADTEAPTFVVAPAPESVISFGGTCEAISSTNCFPSVARDLRWGGAVVGVADTETSTLVVAPAPKSVISFGGT